MSFDYEPEKSAANKAKHGSDLDVAQAIREDPWLLEASARTEDDPRFFVIGRVGRRHWAAVCTHRNGNVRIISVRRARKQKIGRYKSA